MRTLPSCVLLVALVAASAGAQSPGDPGSLTPAPSLDAAGGGAGRPTAAASAVDPRTHLHLPGRDELLQDQDYSMRGLFMQSHGDFMLKHERFTPDFEVTGRAFPSSSIKGKNGHFDLFQGDVDLRPKFMVSTDAYAVIGAYLNMRRYETSNIPNFGDETLYGVGLHLGLGYFFDENTLLEAQFDPGLWSDLDHSENRRDYDYYTRILATWRMDEDFFFKFGARYNQVFRDAPFLPYLGCSWIVGRRTADGGFFRVDILLPESVEVSYWPNASFGALLGTEIQGAKYHVRNSAAQGNQQDDVQAQEIITYGGLIYRMNDNLSFRGRIGLTVAGDNRLTDGTNGINITKGTLDPAFFAEVSFGFSF
jgi:hypothetical protein